MRAVWRGLCLGLYLCSVSSITSALRLMLPDHISQPCANVVSGQHVVRAHIHSEGTGSVTYNPRGRALRSTDINETSEEPDVISDSPKHEHTYQSKSLWERLKHGFSTLTAHHFRPKHTKHPNEDSRTSALQGSRLGSEGNSSADQGLPMGFDWEAYVALHPDLQQAGIFSQTGAQQHYLQSGRQEGRIFKRPKLILHYTACGGLTNQIYSHIPAFVLSAALEAALMLPPALMRSSFGHHFHELTWTSSDTGLLLDVDRVIAEWHARGMAVFKTPSTDTLPALATPDKAWPVYQSSEEEERYTVRLENIYQKAWELQNLTQMVFSAVAEHARQLSLQDDQAMDHLNIYLPCTMFMLQTVSDEEKSRAAEAARLLHFEPALRQLADKVMAGLGADGLVPFNALHLRIERDAKDWTALMGGEETVKLIYGKAMHEAAFNATTPLYIGSGLLTYGAGGEVQAAEEAFLGWQLGKSVHTKEMYLTEDDLNGLASEQKAVLDFLVLGRGEHFVGLSFSTFSFFLRQYRVLQEGLPFRSSVLIAGQPLFSQAGILVLNTTA